MLEDDITFSVMLKTWLSKRDFVVDCVSTVADAKRMMDRTYDVVLSDLRLPDEDGIVLLSWMKSNGLEIPFIVMTSYAEVQSAVHSMKLGAFDFVAKPINPEELHKKINEALAQKSLQGGAPKAVPFADYIPGKSEASLKLQEYILLVAPTQMSVLISGENGSGKGVVAHQIHVKSGRKSDVFVVVDCATLSRETAFAELFGCVKSADVVQDEEKWGYFRKAHGGTLFLEGIENLPQNLLTHLSQALREQAVRPQGAEKAIPVDVRLLASTSQSDAAMESLGELYHQINEFSISVPSLRERKGDVMLYADRFLEQANATHGKQIVGFDKEAISLLTDFAWPGNLRQLKNVVNRVALLSKTPFVGATLLPSELRVSSAGPDSNGLALRDTNSEKRKILKALKDCNNNKSQAAALLQIDRKTLYNKMRQLGIFE